MSKTPKNKATRLPGQVRAIKIRLYLDCEQCTYVNKLCGSSRFVYNAELAFRNSIYDAEQRSAKKEEIKDFFNQLKADNPWLSEMHSKAIQQSQQDLRSSYKNFFEHRAGKPVFKRKVDHNDSFRLPVDAFIGVTGNRISFIRALKNIHYKCSRRDERLLNKFQKSVRSVTIRRTAADVYTASVLIDFGTAALPRSNKIKKNESPKAVSLDIGLLDLIIDNEGNKTKRIDVDKYEKKYQKLQKKHSKKYKRAKAVWKKQQSLLPVEKREAFFTPSNRLEKSRKKAAKAAAKIANVRDYQHHQAINQYIDNYDIICIEDLNIKGMMKNHKLARAFARQAISAMYNKLIYKALWYRRTVIKVDRFFASSKLCSGCGYKNGLLRLSDREWVCPHCGQVHDRDINAAQNILAEGLRLYNETLPLSSGKVRHVDEPTMDDKDCCSLNNNPLKSSVQVKR